MLLSLCCSVVIMLYCYCVALLLFVLSYVLIVCTVPLPPGVNPIAVDRYIKFLESASLQVLDESCLLSWLPMFRYRRVVLVWLRLCKILFGLFGYIVKYIFRDYSLTSQIFLCGAENLVCFSLT